jgi:hypothetical protein
VADAGIDDDAKEESEQGISKICKLTQNFHKDVDNSKKIKKASETAQQACHFQTCTKLSTIKKYAMESRLPSYCQEAF